MKLLPEDIRILVVSLLGPLLGSLAGIAIKPRESILLSMLSFAGGTMLGISFLQMLPESLALCGITGCILGMSIGVLLMLAIGDFAKTAERRAAGDRGKLEATSLLMVVAIFLHNFPEGIAMAAGTQMSHSGKAMLIAIALAIHDIPEGICTSAPYYYATGRRLRAFLLSVSTAIPVICGFFLGKSIFAGMSRYAIGMMIGAVAGMMIYITCKELIPTAQGGRFKRISMAALMVGIIFVLILGHLTL
ncbi:MAG: ZIP family metal transporter [Angelakisella sp.]